MKKTGQGKGELPTFDGWRGIAILAVLLDHWSLSGRATLLDSILGYGSRGVDVFFGISGFLICNRLLSEERRYGSVSIRGFYIRRVFRILPVFLIYLAVIACIAPVQWEGWRAALLLYRNYVPAAVDWDTRHFWSLAVEEHFYLIMPLLFVLARARRASAFIGLAALLAVWSGIDSGLHLTHAPEMRFRTDYRMPALLMGCVAAIVLANYSKSLARIPKPEIIVPLLGVLFVAAEIVPSPYRLILQAPLVPVMLLSTTLHPTSQISSLLQWRPLAMLGKVSYGLYVWQQFFLTPESNVLAIQRFPLNIAILASVVVLSLVYIETPLIALAHKLSAREKALAATARSAPGVRP